MELLILLPILGLLALYIAYKEWLNIAYRQWQAEMDLFKRRLAAYDELKSAVGGVSAGPAAAPVDTERFAQAMSDMRFLFDEDVERFVGGLYEAALKKHALDALLEKVNGHGKAPADQALIEQALDRSRELASQISNGIYREMPEHMEKFMRRRPLSSAAHSTLPPVMPSRQPDATRTFETSLAKPGRLASDFGPGIPVSGESFREARPSATIRNDLLVSV